MKTGKKRTFCGVLSMALCVALAFGAAGCNGNTGNNENTTPGGPTQEPVETPPATSVVQAAEKDSSPVSYTALGAVKNTDAYAVNGLEKEVAYLLKLDADRLLADFRANAHLPAVDGKTAYTSELAIGARWEGALIGGHTLGHYMSAIAQAYANAGTSAQDKEKIGERIEYIVSVLKECQDNAVSAGAKEGFLWGARVISNTNPEIQFDNLEATPLRANIQTEAWVPWYTMHKILAGLLDLYTIAGNETAFTVAKKLGDWTYARVSKWSSAKQAQVLGIEYGGMNDALYHLYAITGEAKYAEAAHKFDERTLFDTILEGKTNYLNDKHANTTIPKIIGALNGYIQLTKAPVNGIDVEDYYDVARRFWSDVIDLHTYVTGGNSEWEHFGKDEVLDGERTNCNCETCNTYNMLKLSRMLFSLQKDPTGSAAHNYLDYYENTYINAILSSQNPETGMTTYFQPMASGYFKVYSTEEGNFWCCTGSGMESFSKLNDSIYYDAGNATYVSLYFSSVYTGKNVTLTQTADLENSDDVTIHVDKGQTILRLRVPKWSASFKAEVNDAPVEMSGKEYFVSLSVKEGDTVKVHMEKTVTVSGLPDQAGEYPVYAFKYGPFVLSAELGKEDMATTTTGVGVTIPRKAVTVKPVEVAKDTEGGSAEDFLANIGKYLVRGEDGKFTLQGTTAATPYVFSYHYKQYQQRYAIYLEFADNGKVTETAEPYTWERQDTVQPGYGQYETDELHAMQEENTQGVTNDGTYRYAQAGGWFTYRMAVDKTTENRITVHLRGADKGKTLRISAGGTELFASTLTKTDTEYQITIELPKSVVGAAEHITANGEEYDVITLKFEGVDGAGSAKVCSYIYSDRRVSNTAYFVDCGDYTPSTTADGDYFGDFNSVTEQVYGADPVTGKMWGLKDDHGTNIAGAPAAGKGIGTNSTWAFEGLNANGNYDKTETNRYTKNQTENNVARNLNYWFELEDGDYFVEVYFTDPWGVSQSPNMSANGTAAITAAATNRAIQTKVTVTGGILKLVFTSDNPCINLAYIRIMYA